MSGLDGSIAQEWIKEALSLRMCLGNPCNFESDHKRHLKRFLALEAFWKPVVVLLSQGFSLKLKMPVTFSGWQVVEGRKPLHGDEEPMGGQVYTMYHGTHIKNATTIITQGFQRSQGGLLGAGVYISRNKEKAKCYPLKVDKKDKVVFKLRVNVGKVKKIDCDNHPLQKSWHQNGYDCAWVPPKSNISSIKSGREEDCVWDPNNIKIVDVACCMDRAKCKDLRKLIKSQRMSGEECTYCLQDMGTGPHPIQNCWQCNKSICPFQRKHFCEQNWDFPHWKSLIVANGNGLHHTFYWLNLSHRNHKDWHIITLHSEILNSCTPRWLNLHWEIKSSEIKIMIITWAYCYNQFRVIIE